MVSAYMCVTDGQRVVVGVKRKVCFWMKGGELNRAFEGRRIPFVDHTASCAYYVYKHGIPITNNPEQNVFPGGRVDKFENGTQAALREWIEEMGSEAVIPELELKAGVTLKLDNLFYVHFVRVSAEQLDVLCDSANNVLATSRRDWFRDSLLQKVFEFTHKEFIFEPPLYSDEMSHAKVYSIHDILTSEVFTVNDNEKLSGSYFLSAVKNIPKNMLFVDSVDTIDATLSTLKL